METEIEVQLKNRVVGSYTGKQPGPLVICLGGVHGNELAGIHGMQRVFKYLHELQPEFIGTFVGLAGNLAAMDKQERFIDVDLNRQWGMEHIELLKQTPEYLLKTQEDREQKELIELIDYYLEQNFSTVLFMDLHTTSAFGGVFTITNNVKKSVHFAASLNVPVITGLHDVLHGTTLNYFEHLGIPGIGFEAGQHRAPSSVDNVIGALFMILAGAGCIQAKSIPEYQHYHTHLFEYGIGLPKFVEFLYRHPVNQLDGFQMKRGYQNFQHVLKNEAVASDLAGEIFSPEDGLILMPLYQPKGQDGFFIIREIDQKMLEAKEFRN